MSLQLVRSDPAVSTFELLADWQRFVTVGRGFKPATARMYMHYLFSLQARLLPRPLAEATEKDVLALLESFGAHGSSRSMAARAARSFFSWALDSGRIPVDPTARIRSKKPKEGPAPYLSREDLTRLVIAARWREERRGWAILLMANTGVRLESAVCLAPEDADDGTLHIRVAKGDRPYSVPLNASAQAAVEALRGFSDGRRLIGVGKGRLWQWIHQAGQDAGFRAYPHLLRHYFASHLAENGVHPNTIAELMNHGDLGQLIRRYVAIHDPVRRAAVERIG